MKCRYRVDIGAPGVLVALALALAIGPAACGGQSFDHPLTLGGRVVEPQVLDRGRDIFNRFCATCHGFNGDGDTPQGRQLDPRPRDFTAAHFKHKTSPGDALPTDAELANTVRNGVPGTGMPAWPNLDDEERDAVLQYIKTFSPRWQKEKPGSASQTPSENAPRGP